MFDVAGTQTLVQLAISCGIDYYGNVECSAQQGVGSDINFIMCTVF